MKTQNALTPRALIIGSLGSAVLTASSLYIALKMGALPWPIVFAVLVSVGALRLFGSRNLHEANVCHAAMSAGSMVAGGLAFTIPGLWIFARANGASFDVSLPEVLIATLGGTVLGLGACALLQPYFIRDQKLPYPVGQSAAETLQAMGPDQAKQEQRVLFGSMGFAALYALVRDSLHALPSLFVAGTLPGGGLVAIMNSPMMLAMGYLIGVMPALVWLVGALIGVALLYVLPAFGIDLVTVEAARQSLGLGLMLGVGGGIIVSGAISAVKARAQAAAADTNTDSRRYELPKVPVALGVSALAAVAGFALNLGPLASALLIVATWFCVYLAAWLTGVTGINPMEIFGVLVLVSIHVLFSQVSVPSLFLAAAVVAVACGLCGDVMNDFKAGDVLRTPPHQQFVGEAVGALVGAVVAAVLLKVLETSYGQDAFGGTGFFVAAQANVVATLAGGIPHVPTFIVGVVAGLVLALAKLPVMTLGLGVYLPLYISLGAAAGALVRLAADKIPALTRLQKHGGTIAAGLLGGESLMGVLLALILIASMLM